MAAVSTISSVEGLRDQFHVIDNAINKAPFLEPVVQQLAPLLLIAFNSL
jgi:hypothetical protein